jgi:hypothetical protein
MKLSAPIPWSLVPAGAVVLLPDHTVRTVHAVLTDKLVPYTVLMEGLPPRLVDPNATVELVILDETDAVATLAAAGLNPEIIKETP